MFSKIYNFIFPLIRNCFFFYCPSADFGFFFKLGNKTDFSASSLASVITLFSHSSDIILVRNDCTHFIRPIKLCNSFVTFYNDFFTILVFCRKKKLSNFLGSLLAEFLPNVSSFWCWEALYKASYTSLIWYLKSIKDSILLFHRVQQIGFTLRFETLLSNILHLWVELKKNWQIFELCWNRLLQHCKKEQHR
jgi:hypothetical protein